MEVWTISRPVLAVFVHVLDSQIHVHLSTAMTWWWAAPLYESPHHTHTHNSSHLQLVNIGSQYSYSSEDQSEFLVVVSKEFDEPPRSADVKPTDKELVSPLIMWQSSSRGLPYFFFQFAVCVIITQKQELVTVLPLLHVLHWKQTAEEQKKKKAGEAWERG